MPVASNKPKNGDLEVLKTLLGGGSSGGSGGGRVYMGALTGAAKGVDPRALKNVNATEGRQERWLSKDEAAQDYYGWSKKRQQDFISQGIVGGILKLGDGPMEGARLWNALVEEAAKYGAAGKKVTPMDLLASYVHAAGGGKGSVWARQGDFEVNTVTGERRYVGPRFKTTTDTRVDLTDPDTARAIATKLFQDMMGRDPGAGELAGFAKALNTAEQNSPVVATTTTEYDMATGEPIGQNTTQAGGISAEGKALIGENRIKKSKEYGTFQAATTYMGALENAIYGAPE